MATEGKNGRSVWNGKNEWANLSQSLWGQPQRPNPRDEKQESDAEVQKNIDIVANSRRNMKLWLQKYATHLTNHDKLLKVIVK